MQFPESWLREFCNPPLSTRELARTLTMGGFEVEETRPVAPPFSGVVVAEIVEVVQHPNADRLRVCQVNVGDGTLRSIVCGAPNARIGIRVPCALVGALLPPTPSKDASEPNEKPFEIKLGQLRGIESQGMLCSATELQFADDHAGLYELPQDAPVGQSIRTYLNLDDIVFTIKLTPNLGHALSVYGVARELAALTGAPLKRPTFPTVPINGQASLPVKISAPDLCGRFSGRVIQNVNTQAKTPQWMVDKLARCGQRSVTALVDISNFVMFEFGRPTHIFDLDKIHGALDVRWGKPGESLKLLNGNTVQLDSSVGVIADDSSVESLAGIMGGDSTSVTNDTTNVYLEAAFWWPQAVAGRSRKFNFATDAGHRFERGVDASQTVEHLEHISALILQICGTPHTQVGSIDDQKPAMPTRQPVQLRATRAAKVIGMPITSEACVAALKRCDFETEFDGDVITVTPPAHRFDLLLEEDLIEEVVRIIGFDNLPNTAPIAPVVASVRSEGKINGHALRRLVATLGYTETINFSFVDARWESDLTRNVNPIRLLNPIASQMSVMRSSLLGGLIHVLKYNLDRKASSVRIFELGRVFERDTAVQDSESQVKGIHQPIRLAGLSYGLSTPEQWGVPTQKLDFFDVKADVQAIMDGQSPVFVAAVHPAMHPGRCAEIFVDERSIGFVGELHPKWRQSYGLPEAPLVWELDSSATTSRKMPVVAPISKHQAVERDLALVVSETVSHDALLNAINAPGSPALLRDTRVFDIYRTQHDQPGLLAKEKSFAVRLTLQGDGNTLTEAEIEAAVAQVLQCAASGVGARLRTQ